ncbi:hypothetical protein NPIL_369721 [Nephila pilipes]|uniref:Uncharacterized protein n=1 Tax=Nephila pilipes TaxID=299642 RepID=A0A8X6NBP3_NEPPI|nr:hypothetical protein NPIL_369721 [Nephila pilipes]
MKLAVEIHAEHADSNVSPTGEAFRVLSPRNTFRTSTRRRQQQDKHHLTVPNERDHPEDMHTPSEDSGVDLANGTIFGHGSRKGSRAFSPINFYLGLRTLHQVSLESMKRFIETRELNEENSAHFYFQEQIAEVQINVVH